MKNITDVANELMTKAKETAGHLATGATKAAKEAAVNANEKRALRQVEKKRATAKNAALVALTDAANDLDAFNKNLTNSKVVRTATETLISEVEKLKEMIAQMTPETLVPIFEEQKEKWLDDKNLTVDGENFAQMELDKSEIIKRRKMAAKRCDKAIAALKKQAEEEQ